MPDKELQNALKIQPKLRMIANGSTGVNAVRAERSGSVSLREEIGKNFELRRTKEFSIRSVASGVTALDLPLPEPLEELSSDVLVSVFVTTRNAGAEKLPGEGARRNNIVLATVPISSLNAITDRPDVVHVQLGESVAAPTPVRNAAPVAPSENLRRFGDPAVHGFGEGILVGIVDVEGFDFSHPDFLKPDGTTRWVAIWDQAGSNRPAPKTQGCRYGSEILAAHMDAAITGNSGVAPTELEPQTQMIDGAHGTHVASIAAGNLGVCRKAEIAGVLLNLPKDDLDRRRSLYDSTAIARAIDYLLDLADRRGKKCVINVSLGTNGHAHDGSAAISRWIDSAMSFPGRCICVAAGNAGQEIAEFPGDSGFVMGRIHTSGRLAGAGLVNDIEWIVAGNGIIDLSENELELWFSSQDRIGVSVRPPGSDKFIGPIKPGEFIQNEPLADGSFFSIYNEVYHPANGANYISVYLSPRMDPDQPIVGVRAGTWLVRLHAIEIRDGRFHGWIERDDPNQLGRVGDRQAWNFPSFFSERSNVDNTSVSSLACGNQVVTVANYESSRDRINISSSQGPTRDGRSKPDVAAPGTEIIAASGFTGSDKRWLSMTGTSMAAPFVTGVAGLMLAIEPKLTAAQIEGILHRTAVPLPGSGHEWGDAAGFGVIDPESCLKEAAVALTRKEVPL